MGYSLFLADYCNEANKPWSKRLWDSRVRHYRRARIGTNWNQLVELGVWKCLKTWWPGTESNRRRQPFQGCALPTELPGHRKKFYRREQTLSIQPEDYIC